MKCKECDNEWESKSDIYSIYETIGVNSKISIVEILKTIIQTKGKDILLNGDKVYSMIMDLTQGYDREKKLLKIASQNGIFKFAYNILNLENKEEIKVQINKYKYYLKENAFLSEENVSFIVNLVLEAISIECKLCSDDRYNLTESIVQDEKEGIIQNKDIKITKNFSVYSESNLCHKKLSKEEYIQIFYKGKQLLTYGNEKEGIYWIKFASDAGINEATIYLGECYEIGRGIKKDLKIAEGFYRRAAVSGYHIAEFKLGVLLERGGNEVEGNKWIQKAKDAGNIDAIRYEKERNSPEEQIYMAVNDVY